MRRLGRGGRGNLYAAAKRYQQEQQARLEARRRQVDSTRMSYERARNAPIQEPGSYADAIMQVEGALGKTDAPLFVRYLRGETEGVQPAEWLTNPGRYGRFNPIGRIKARGWNGLPLDFLEREMKGGLKLTDRKALGKAVFDEFYRNAYESSERAKRAAEAAAKTEALTDQVRGENARYQDMFGRIKRNPGYLLRAQRGLASVARRQ